ncbi:YbcN family protein [Pluralibacter gergoviae]|uniref:YbcN family protein n=1 Tax=Pluralibacter gergoviae TaxID=61647 RepID=A0AAI9DR71_PLUGE|nr:YbcN family protein [Pluralibacter gergoviae]EKV9911266.1 YbcN family protein [Pluralibacter gergoviae]EKW7277226.1 YbcN family protein [Pluralibacter gergoviae]ELD4298718.1 YbcN family protein [Pluralibacter gergoviae]ELD4309498.1 YbcN family protein [Pluralibacter gergoviae]
MAQNLHSIHSDGIKLHRGNFAAVGQKIQRYLDGGKCYRLILKDWRESRSLPQNNLSHVWYKEISDYLIKSGRSDATPEWVKRNLKKTYLGCEEVTYTDFVTGEKETSWEPRHTSDLNTAEMHDFMTKVEMWCAQFGLVLTIPRNCEYQQLRDKQEA